MRGYRPGRFSFNVKGGRCEACGGDGVRKIEMHFLPDVYVQCQVCNGRRFNDQTLEIRYKGLNISEVLELSVEDALKAFGNIPPGTPEPAVWPLKNAFLYTVIWIGIIVAVFAPLAINRFRKAR